MIDKNELLIQKIDIDVSDCMYLDGNYCPNHDTKCDFVDNCYFREYKRKMQECEEPEKQQQANQPTGICETCTAKAILQNDKYRKALEEIEEYTKNFKELDLFEDIKDIINKVKGEGNE